MEQRLKIVIVDGSFKTTPFINRLAMGLAGKHRVFILGFNEELKYPIPGVHYVSLGSNQNKVRFVDTALGTLLRSRAFNLLIPTLKKLLQGERHALQQQNLTLALTKITPDVIHVQWPSTLRWFEPVLTKQNIPVVLSQRGFHNNVRPFVDPDNHNYLKTWYPKLAGFHSVSKAISINGDKIWSAPEKTDRVVYTGLPIDNFDFNTTYTKTTPLQLLSIGRPHWKKGYAYALRACKLLQERGIAFHYTIIGGSGDEELQYLLHDLELQDQVTLENRLPQNTVFKQMQEASLLLMTSVEEGLPNVAVEAMAIGLPVLSTDCGGVPELIDHGKNGWLVPTRDPGAMAASIFDFINLTRSHIETVRTAARKKVAQQHNESLMIEGMVGLYKTVLEEARKSKDEILPSAALRSE